MSSHQYGVYMFGRLLSVHSTTHNWVKRDAATFNKVHSVKKPKKKQMFHLCICTILFIYLSP